MGHGDHQPLRIFYVVTGIVFQVDWVKDQAGLHTCIIAEVLSQKQLRPKVPRAPTGSELILAAEGTYAEGGVYSFSVEDLAA